MYNLKNYGFVLVIAAVGATPIPKIIKKRIDGKIKNTFFLDTAEILLLVALLLISTGYLADGSFNPFLYFRF